MNNLNLIENSIYNLRTYIEKEEFKGYDPYDTLNSFFPFSKFGKWLPILAIQFQKRNPINIRRIIGIKKEHNPKAIGLLLNAYSLLYRNNKSAEIKHIIDYLFDWLNNNYSKGYSGYCWGYNFNWANPQKVLKSYHPSIVVTSFVGNGIFAYHQVTNIPKASQILESICDYFLNDLPITENEDGICFSYTDVIQDCCYNASMLGAEILSKTYYLTGYKNYLEKATNAVDFVLANQHNDGHWNYSIDLKTGIEDEQIDFHQGFIIKSLKEFINYCDVKDSKYLNALINASNFYLKEQFSDEGRSKWRLPKEYPVDIHNQAQGIITFTNLKKYSKNYMDFAYKIALWTIKNMQDKDGYFYYQNHKLYINKISYMRWSQAWMLYALSYFYYNSTKT